MPSPRPQNTLTCGPALLASLRGCTLGSLSLTVLATPGGTPSFGSLPIRLSTISSARCVWIFREQVLTRPTVLPGFRCGCWLLHLSNLPAGKQDSQSPPSGHPATLTGFPLELHLLALGRKEHPAEGEETASQHELSTSPRGSGWSHHASCLHRDIGREELGGEGLILLPLCKPDETMSGF